MRMNHIIDFRKKPVDNRMHGHLGRRFARADNFCCFGQKIDLYLVLWLQPRVRFAAGSNEKTIGIQTATEVSPSAND